MSNSYESWSKNELIEYIGQLNNQIDDFLKREDHQFFVQFKWAGNLGQWYWYIKDNRVLFNNKKVETLGYDPNVVGEIGFEFFTNKIHPDDYERVMDNMRDHMYGRTEAYEVEYRIQHKEGYYIWFYDSGTVTKRNDSGQPILLQGVVFDITESKKMEEQLRYLSERDSLTNVFNRRTMYKKIEQLIHTHVNYKEPFSMIMFDIDHFKLVNDQFGHLVGDDVLRKLTELVIEDKRSNDIVCRYGGEEFFLLLPDTDLEGGIKVAKRLHKMIKRLTIPKVGNITVSIGVVEHQIDESIDQVVKRVDDLMYEAKQAGRDTIKF